MPSRGCTWCSRRWTHGAIRSESATATTSSKYQHRLSTSDASPAGIVPTGFAQSAQLDVDVRLLPGMERPAVVAELRDVVANALDGGPWTFDVQCDRRLRGPVWGAFGPRSFLNMRWRPCAGVQPRLRCSEPKRRFWRNWGCRRSSLALGTSPLRTNPTNMSPLPLSSVPPTCTPA